MKYKNFELACVCLSDNVLQKKISNSTTALSALYSSFADCLCQHLQELKMHNQSTELQVQEEIAEVTASTWDSLESKIACYESAVSIVSCVLSIKRYVKTTEKGFTIA